MKKSLVVSITGIALFFAARFAWASDWPEEADIQVQVTQALLAGGGSTFYEVKNVRQTKGIPNETGTYAAYFEYDLVFKMSSAEADALIFKGDPERTGDKRNPLAKMAAFLPWFGPFKKGELVHATGGALFAKSAKGWVIREW